MYSQIICVPGCPELAAEFAVAASINKDLNILVIDIDTINPSMDLVLNVNKECDKLKSFTNQEDNTGLNIVLDAYEKKVLTKEMLLDCLQQKKPNLYVMPGNYNIDNYEYYLPDGVSLLGLLGKAQETFNLIVIAASGFIYDDFTYQSMLHSDIVLMPIRGNILSLRNTNSEIAFLNEMYRLDKSKAHYVVFEYSQSDLELKIINELAKGRLMGVIPYSIKRVERRNKRASYAMRLEPDVLRQYTKLLKHIGLPVNHKATNKFVRLSRKLKKAVFKVLHKKGKKKAYAGCKISS